MPFKKFFQITRKERYEIKRKVRNNYVRKFVRTIFLYLNKVWCPDRVICSTMHCENPQRNRTNSTSNDLPSRCHAIAVSHNTQCAVISNNNRVLCKVVLVWWWAVWQHDGKLFKVDLARSDLKSARSRLPMALVTEEQTKAILSDWL